MFISDEEYDERQNVERIDLSKEELEELPQEDLSEVRPRKPNGREGAVGKDTDLTPEQRAEIGVMSQFGTAKEVADLYGVHPASVRNRLRHGRYNGGKLKHEEEIDPVFKKTERDVRGTIEDVALGVVSEALGGIGSDDIEDLSPMKKAQLADRVAGIVGKITKKDQNGGFQQQNIIFYSPRVRDEEEYGQVIDVGGENGNA